MIDKFPILSLLGGTGVKNSIIPLIHETIILKALELEVTRKSSPSSWLRIEVKQKVMWDTEYVNIQYTYPMYMFTYKVNTGGGIFCMYYGRDTYRIFFLFTYPSFPMHY